jgi:hypothetical protein
MKLHISSGNTKLGKTPNISLTPGITCGINLPCQHKCYCRKSWKRYPNVRKAWHANFLCSLNAGMFKHDIEAYLHKHKPRYFRIHVAGDFYSQKYVDQWRCIAIHNRKVKFLAYTKRYDLNFNDSPKNLIIRFSYWGMKQARQIPSTMPCAITVLKESTKKFYLENNIKQCPGKCGLSCRHCWNSTKPVFFNLH